LKYVEPGQTIENTMKTKVYGSIKDIENAEKRITFI